MESLRDLLVPVQDSSISDMCLIRLDRDADLFLDLVFLDIILMRSSTADRTPPIVMRARLPR